MIRLEVTLSGSVLASVHASGHASGKSESGGNIVCAAVTMLLRTAAQLLEREASINIQGESKEPGSMDLEIVSVSPERRSWFEGITDYVVFGLQTLEREYPDKLYLQIQED